MKLKSPINLKQKLYMFTLKDLILIILSCIIFGFILGVHITGSLRYMPWLIILFLSLALGPAYKWFKTRGGKRKHDISDE